jgi:hypothetical protein
MKMQNKKLFIAVAVASLTCLSTAYASWEDGGWGIVKFGAGNPNKIIYLQQVRPHEQDLGRGVDINLYDPQVALSNQRKARNTFPAGSIPEQNYDPQRSGTDYVRLTSEGPVVWSHISKSNGVDCLQNEASCAVPAIIVGTSECTYHKVKTTISAEITGGVETAAKVNNVDTTVGGAASGAFIREWESGWESCQVEGTAHACIPEQHLTYDAVNFATTESRSQFGWHKFTTSGNTFFFNARYTRADADFCRTHWNGNYVSGGFLIEPKQGRCEVASAKAKPSYERYERMPLPSNGGTSPIAPTCRTIKKTI